MSHQQNISELIKHKRTMKANLAKELKISSAKPLVAIFLDGDLGKREKSLMSAIEGSGSLGVEVVVLTDMEHRKMVPENATHFVYNQKNRKKLLEAADIALGFSFNDVEEMLLHGTIPVSAKRPEVQDYNPNKESGNSFIYQQSNQWGVFAALVRAIETFKFPYDWKHIIRQGLESVCKA